MKKIGITTTIPTEILMAAGYQPVDLNNIFISDPNPGRLISIAERDGFPLNCCAWIKGIYGVCKDSGIDSVICVTSGDCSNTLMLMEVLRLKGVTAIPFAYPEEPDVEQVTSSLMRLAVTLGTTLEAAEVMRKELAPARKRSMELDEQTWQKNQISGMENHYWLVSASDFNEDHHQYQNQLEKLLTESQQRKPYPKDMIRLAFTGVPAIFGADLYPYLEEFNARVVFNEVQRQFAMPETSGTLAEQYAAYTYPYPLKNRLADIETEIDRRRIDGVIHYVQAFCHRSIGDIILRHNIDLPVLTLEGNNEFTLGQQARTKIEAFLDIVQMKRQQKDKATQQTT